MAGLDHGTETQEETVQDGRLEITCLIIKMAHLDYKVHHEVLWAANASKEIQDKGPLGALTQTASNLLKKYLGAYQPLKDAKTVLQLWHLVSLQNAAPQLTESWVDISQFYSITRCSKTKQTIVCLPLDRLQSTSSHVTNRTQANSWMNPWALSEMCNFCKTSLFNLSLMAFMMKLRQVDRISYILPMLDLWFTIL